MTEESLATNDLKNQPSAVMDPPPQISGPANRTPAAMTDAESGASQPPTLREFFGLPEKPSDKGDDCWKTFQEKLVAETRDIKWTAAMPDLGSKIGELLDIKIHQVLLTAWKKVEAVRQALEESKQTPDKASYLDLTEHSVDYETKPFIDVKIKKASVKKLTFTVALNLKVKGFGLKIQNGLIREMQTGKCEGKGTIKYEKLSIAEKQFEPIKFPVSIEIPNLEEPSAAKSPSRTVTTERTGAQASSLARPEDDDEDTVTKDTKGPASKNAEQLERIEL
jgi:hypothetical protein